MKSKKWRVALVLEFDVEISEETVRELIEGFLEQHMAEGEDEFSIKQYGVAAKAD